MHCGVSTPGRAPEAPSFTVQADSHLDVNADVRVYQTLANMLGDKPDFMIDLGDTTMVDKWRPFIPVPKAMRAQRFYIGRIAHSVPVILTLGNHDGELGSRASPGRHNTALVRGDAK
ncbi:MAG: metallophosphoesterase family protein [Verrucomicrobiales bacterium]